MRWAITALAITALACGNPTTPTALSPAEQSDFSGVWRGEYQVTACNGARDCFAYRGTQRTFSLRLSQTGTNVFGVLTVGGVVNIGGGVSVDMTGTVNPSGLLTLTGSRTAASASDPNGDIQVTRFAVQRDIQRGLTGSLEYVVRYTSQQNPETGSVSWAGDLTTASRVGDVTQPLSFTGHWVGNYIVRQCVPVGWTFCLPEMANHVYPFDLRLTQSVTALTGTMAWSSPAPANMLAVTGRTSLDTLIVEGTATGVQSGVDADVLRITAWATTRDDLGRMHGSFSFVRETHWGSTSALAGAVWTINYDAELVNVVLQPW